jgi:hypothetical protein
LVALRTVESGRPAGLSSESDPDAELEAMETIGSALEGLDEEARQCVLAWAGARFSHTDAAPSPESESPSAWDVR